MSETSVRDDWPTVIGGLACLDLVNTVDPRHSLTRREYLTDYGAFVSWARHAGVIDAALAERLHSAATGAKAEADEVVARVVHVREALYRTLAAGMRGEIPQTSDLTALNEELAAALPHLAVSFSSGSFAWAWDDSAVRLDAPLWPLVRSAAELLTDGPLDRVRECPGDDGSCGWLFVDLTRNSRRRWCDMRTCGNRAKARRFYTSRRVPQVSGRP